MIVDVTHAKKTTARCVFAVRSQRSTIAGPDLHDLQSDAKQAASHTFVRQKRNEITTIRYSACETMPNKRGVSCLPAGY